MKPRGAKRTPHIEAFYNKFLKMPVEMLLPPGYLSLASMAVGDRQDPRRAGRGRAIRSRICPQKA